MVGRDACVHISWVVAQRVRKKKNNIIIIMKVRQIIAVAVLGLLSMGLYSCSSDELTNKKEIVPGASEVKPVTMHVHLEGQAGGSTATTRAGGVYMSFDGLVPLFKVDDAKTVLANCVFKRFKKDTDEFEEGTEMYGQLEFKKVTGSEPDLKGNTGSRKAVPVKMVCDQTVQLTPAKLGVTVGVGERWAVMGIVGGAYSKDEAAGTHKVAVKGMMINIKKDQQYSELDTPDKANSTVPFLAKWTKLNPIVQTDKVSSAETMKFKAQGLLIKIDLTNDTKYHLDPVLIKIQSTVLANKIAYDLSPGKLPKYGSEEKAYPWEYTGERTKTGTWMVNSIFLSGPDGPLFHLDPKEDGKKSELHDKKDKEKQTIFVWSHVVDAEKPSTGFYVESVNTEAKPSGVDNTIAKLEGKKVDLKKYKYVLTSDNELDDIMDPFDYRGQHKKFDKDIKVAPGVNWLLVKVLRKPLSGNLGKFVTCQLAIPQRDVMPIEMMAQNNLYQYRIWPKNGQHEFAGYPNTKNPDARQTASYTKQWVDNINKNDKWQTWAMPTFEQWTAMLIGNGNDDHVKNFDHEDDHYNWIEFDNEKLQFADGTTGQYSSAYIRLPKDDKYHNRDVVYGLRFFKYGSKTEGSKYFSLYRYNMRNYDGPGTKSFCADAIYLGPLFMQLYEGFYKDLKDLMHIIAINDDGKPGSVFTEYYYDTVNRYLLMEDPKDQQYDYGHVKTTVFDESMGAGYFYAPTKDYTTSAAKAIVFKQDRIFTGISKNQGNTDFTDYKKRNNADVKGYIRPIRKDFMQFKY